MSVVSRAPRAQHGATMPIPASTSDQHSRHAALTMALTLPGDVLLYLLLPMFATQFGVSLLEVGILLAANRLVRIAGYGWVARFYARHGDRRSCMLAALAATLSTLGYALASGFWALLPLRLLWGLAFAALNLSTQTLATAELQAAAHRNGRSRALIALGPALALPLGAALAQWQGPRMIFLILALLALAGLYYARKLPAAPHPEPARKRRLRLPGSLDTWSFLEGFTLDGLFIIGLSYMARTQSADDALVLAGALLGLRYVAEILFSPLGGRLAERVGAERLLLWLSVLTAIVLTGFGFGWIWSAAGALVILRALQLPLLPPIVARRHPGPGRVQALAARAVWRDIGAGTGPLAAGLLLPVMAPQWLYALPAALLVLAAMACVRPAAAQK